MKLIIEDSEKGKREINYATLTASELKRRLLRYERKYGYLEAVVKDYHCDQSDMGKALAIKDWECLTEELTRRIRPSRPKR